MTVRVNEHGYVVCIHCGNCIVFGEYTACECGAIVCPDCACPKIPLDSGSPRK